jgi:single-strand DNA-binding protein
MANYNFLIVVGRLTKDPELRYLQNGDAVCSLDIATNKKWTDTQGNKKESTTFINTAVFKKQAENCAQYLKKGSTVLIEGELKTESWEKDGKKHSKLAVRTDRIVFMDSKPKDESPGPESEIPEETEQEEASF